jgi:hypothetical protein
MAMAESVVPLFCVAMSKMFQCFFLFFLGFQSAKPIVLISGQKNLNQPITQLKIIV